MVIRPKSDDTFEIVYDIQKTESWDMYAQALDKFLARKSVQWARRYAVQHSVSGNNFFLRKKSSSFHSRPLGDCPAAGFRLSHKPSGN